MIKSYFYSAFMNAFPYQEVRVSHFGVDLFVPDPAQVEQLYKDSEEGTAFPFWSRIWPSALAMAGWLKEESQLINGKILLELGAGIGLPSFVAAQYASALIVSDHVPEALDWMKKNISALGYDHVSPKLINWNHHPLPDADIIMMSDVGYDPTDFEDLRSVVSTAMAKGTGVLLAVPARSVSTLFIEMLLDFNPITRSSLSGQTEVLLLAFNVDQQPSYSPRW